MPMDTENKNQAKVDSHTLYPSMMQMTRLLILDYDVTRYHSFDLFRYLLTDREMFFQCDQHLLEIAKRQGLAEQIIFYMRHCSNINPYDNFKGYKNTMKIDGLESKLNQLLSEDKLKTTQTNVAQQLRVIFDRPGITGYMLKYTEDKSTTDFDDKVKIYRSKNILDLRMALAIIQKHGINAIMVSSVDVAILVAEHLIKLDITYPITFIIGTYYYNYNPDTGIMNKIDLMNVLEFKYKHEFGLFDPYSGINFTRKEDTEP